MRIIAGEFRGRKISCPKTLRVRPTSDRVRESLFNILGDKCAGAVVLDLFAGSGAVGLEAISRGASHVTFVDYAHQALRFLRKNMEMCRDRVNVIPADAMAVISSLSKKQKQFDIIFLDPPYEKGLVREALQKLDGVSLLRPQGHLVVQHSRREQLLDDDWRHFKKSDSRPYGDTVITFFMERS